MTLDAARLLSSPRENSEEIKAIKKAEIRARIVGHCTSIEAEVVSKDIPLLLSKKAMKDANDAKVHIILLTIKQKYSVVT